MSVRHRSRVREQQEMAMRDAHTRARLDWIRFQAVAVCVVGIVGALLLFPFAAILLWFAISGLCNLLMG